MGCGKNRGWVAAKNCQTILDLIETFHTVSVGNSVNRGNGAARLRYVQAQLIFSNLSKIVHMGDALSFL
jgi:hypothetical protein